MELMASLFWMGILVLIRCYLAGPIIESDPSKIEQESQDREIQSKN